MSVAIVLSWYLCGAWAARWMVHRGHSATPWWVGAALLGGMLWALAVPCARISGQGVRWTGEQPGLRTHGRLVVGLVDEAGDIGRAAAAAGRADDHLLLVHRVGREATSSLIETGEQEVAAIRIDATRRRWPGTADARIGSGPREELLTDATGGRPPDLIVRGAPAGWTWRHSLQRSIALGASLGCPILHAPNVPAGDLTSVGPMARNA